MGGSWPSALQVAMISGVASRARLGARVPAVLHRLCCAGASGGGRRPRNVARPVCAAVGLAEWCSIACRRLRLAVASLRMYQRFFLEDELGRPIGGPYESRWALPLWLSQLRSGGQLRFSHYMPLSGLSGSSRIGVPVTVQVTGDFKFLSGEPKAYVKVAASGNRRSLAFCPECGTSVYSRPADGTEGYFGLRVGSLRQRDSLVPRVQYWRRSVPEGDRSHLRAAIWRRLVRPTDSRCQLEIFRSCTILRYPTRARLVRFGSKGAVPPGSAKRRLGPQ